MHSERGLVKRLEETSPITQEIRQVSGNAGISLGISHRGGVIYRANYGYRDVEAELPPDCDTVFPIASMTKAMVGAAFASFVDG